LTTLRTFLGGLVWLAIIVVIAFGAAGLVTGLDHLPGTSTRPELTATGDAQVTPLLAAAEADLAALAEQVDALGTQGRGALAALNGADTTTGDAAIAAGDRLVADVIVRTTALRRELAAVPYLSSADAGLHVSDGVIAHHAALVAALDATDGLDSAWASLTVGSVAATRMSALLAAHDSLIVQAAERGRQAKYADAMKLIDQAEAQITAARQLRDQLVSTVDVTVLDDWLTRNSDYDVALRNLYNAISKVGRQVTAATRAIAAAEKAARARLPSDTRGLVVIMGEIGRGRLNGAVIAIEEARAKLTDALDAGTTEASPGPDSSLAP
jgi:hypothetical protein